MKKTLSIIILAAAILVAGSVIAADKVVVIPLNSSSSVGTKIFSLPATISSPGLYFLSGNLTQQSDASPAITVTVNDVTLDLMGFTLKGLGAASSSAGISISGRSNVEIRNGTVRDFGGGGIHSTQSSSNCRIINIRAIANKIAGIKVVGSNHLIKDCHASNNLGYGIWMSGSGAVITGNVINDNGSNGLQCTSGGNITDNVSHGNAGTGFTLSLATSDYYVIDRNTLYQNTGSNYNGIPSQAVFGINAGIP